MSDTKNFDLPLSPEERQIVDNAATRLGITSERTVRFMVFLLQGCLPALENGQSIMVHEAGRISRLVPPPDIVTARQFKLLFQSTMMEAFGADTAEDVYKVLPDRAGFGPDAVIQPKI